MATLWKRATPSQRVALRIVAGAVMNAAHAHGTNITKSFARSVAKRAIGTLTAQWPDVLAAREARRHQARAAEVIMRPRPNAARAVGKGKGTAGAFRLRSLLLRVRSRLAKQMWSINRNGSPDQVADFVAALRALAQAIEAVEKLESDHG